MGDREIDQQLVERAQRGDRRAFELLVVKYQRKLARLLSRLVRDPAEVEDVTQEAFIKAYRALPSFRGDSAFYTWLYRIAINTAKNYLVAMGRRAPTSTGFDNEDAESFEDAEQLRDAATPEGELIGKQIAATLNRHDAMATWTCYHVIGDAMRGSGTPRDGFAQHFAERFAAEPTVLAPPRRQSPTVAAWGWAIAATLAAVTVVGWTASSLVGDTPAGLAKAGEATAVSAARVRTSTIPVDYLNAHQE